MADKPKRIGDEEIQQNIPHIIRALQRAAGCGTDHAEVTIELQGPHIKHVKWSAGDRTVLNGKPIEQSAAE